MNEFRKILFFFPLFLLTLSPVWAIDSDTQNRTGVTPDEIKIAATVVRGDTILFVKLRELIVFPPLVFKSKKEEKHYWRTVRDVKKALPLAKIAAHELILTNRHLLTLDTDKERKEYLKKIEKDLFKQHEPELRQMSIRQGKMLIKLIDRECDSSSYNLIKRYRGNFSAYLWQGIAKLFGSNLKTTYDPSSEEDKKIERVVTLVEAGLL